MKIESPILLVVLAVASPVSMMAFTSSAARLANRQRVFSTASSSSPWWKGSSKLQLSAEPAVVESSSSSNKPIVNEEAYDKMKMDDLVSLCKRRGIIYPSSEIYNGFAGFYDYGPLGAELKKNVKDLWWRNFVTQREDVVGLDSSIIHNPTTWQSSGHLDGFSDPMVDCKETKLRYRADQLFYSPIIVDGNTVGYVCIQEANDEDMVKEAKKQVKKMLKALDMKGQAHDAFSFKDLTEASEEEMSQIPSPGSGLPTLTMPRDFNLMFQTNVGAMSDASSVAYLRPETAQGIFINFKNVMGTSRMKIPFGIAQIGKAFRNEITPRNFIFRSREFEQMEVEYFIPPGDDVWQPYHETWLKQSKDFLLSLGLREELLGWDVHEGDSLAHYARACTDVTFRFPFGTQELMGIAARGNFDLTSHSEGSGKSLDYFDDATKEKYVPHCIEPSLGVDRLILALICSAYAEDEVGGEKRNFLKFHPSVAPIKVSVLPLVKNKEALVSVARDLYEKLQKRWNVSWDASGAIGRRYRRADEIGTPFCITVDFDTIETDGAVTVRDRDSTEQVRIKMDDLIPYLSEQIDGY
uniref:glycine--tRNA ligase n=1 Tax=Attheya septentrionalis TaxID=420275 RepID=A0A7S2UL72_9STRA|mmetsp:Transcript_3286/g.5978  ORF Transcript_3286/g.5978 Transcript_3286/m.5978 type:complete len:580 (+) Transcript_3286:307-2046(+)|eukprot:CAMPEP_0198303946 /NCGR_PEP_ID=MMETSP1449-20131203/57146_1 /TAXON_ID=420275 /ORGANISM="Attheya septentrionalis, Strain CCMP2084" /LENGTH=579 /DNA_ID=CAMNT_0044006453 /DNA_START=1936 /DNA_END=3675 /DNA_ORIENTATION=+